MPVPLGLRLVRGHFCHCGKFYRVSMVRCKAWHEGRRKGPVPGSAQARKMRPTNGG